MKKSVKSERFKYVCYDPDGTMGLPYGSNRTKRRLGVLGLVPWVAVPNFRNGVFDVGGRMSCVRRFATEREAALFVDKWFLSHGREPVNILVRKP